MEIPNCIICDKELEPAVSVKTLDNVNQPYAGTTFTTHGHYGSTVFDPMDKSVWLEINLCDGCLIKKRDKVLFGVKPPKWFAQPVQYEPWNPFKQN